MSNLKQELEIVTNNFSLKNMKDNLVLNIVDFIYSFISLDIEVTDFVDKLKLNN